jgi:hypothetical protein
MSGGGTSTATALDGRGRLDRRTQGLPWFVAPAAVVGAAASVAALLAVRDPNTTGLYPACPFRALTGMDCPGCGALRGIHALTQGDVVAAADSNLLLVLALPFLAWRWVSWTGQRAGRLQRTWSAPGWSLMVLAMIVLAFWVVRNVPGVPFLAAGSG